MHSNLGEPCKGSGFSNKHTVKRGKYDVYNLHATLSLVAK